MTMKLQKAIRRIKAGEKVIQIAALPYRFRDNGRIEVLLITSRHGGHFIIPKGWPMEGKSHSETAAEEARQEAGVVGKAGRRAIGKLRHWKRLRGSTIPVELIVFPLKVFTQLTTWREKNQRLRKWLSPDHAVGVLGDRRLANIVAQIHNRLPADVASTGIQTIRHVRRFRARPGRRMEIAGRARSRLGMLLAR